VFEGRRLDKGRECLENVKATAWSLSRNLCTDQVCQEHSIQAKNVLLSSSCLVVIYKKFDLVC